MSFNVTRWAIAQLPNLKKGCAKLVLTNLADRSDEEGRAWPGVDRIASDVGMSARSVQRGLSSLAEMGLVRIEPRPNLSSFYFLNLKFSLSGVGDKKSPQNKKVELGVTKSRVRGDKKSPPGVTKSHPNQPLNQPFNQPPQPPVVVVGEIIWEKPLTADEKQSCEQVLAGRADAQKFADEMAGAARVRPINNPAGWMRRVIEYSVRPNFCFEHAERVALAREARTAQAERESLVLPPPARPEGAPPRELSDVGRAALAATRELLNRRKLSTAQVDGQAAR